MPMPKARSPKPNASAVQPNRLQNDLPHPLPLMFAERVHSPAGLAQEALELRSLVVLEAAPGIAGVADDEPRGVVDPLPVDVAGDAAGACGQSGHAEKSRRAYTVRAHGEGAPRRASDRARAV